MARQSFAAWLGNVDRYMLGIVGLSHRDIGDQTWHDWYDDGVGPKAAVREALSNEGFI